MQGASADQTVDLDLSAQPSPHGMFGCHVQSHISAFPTSCAPLQYHVPPFSSHTRVPVPIPFDFMRLSRALRFQLDSMSPLFQTHSTPVIACLAGLSLLSRGLTEPGCAALPALARSCTTLTRRGSAESLRVTPRARTSHTSRRTILCSSATVGLSRPVLASHSMRYCSSGRTSRACHRALSGVNSARIRCDGSRLYLPLLCTGH